MKKQEKQEAGKNVTKEGDEKKVSTSLFNDIPLEKFNDPEFQKKMKEYDDRHNKMTSSDDVSLTAELLEKIAKSMPKTPKKG